VVHLADEHWVQTHLPTKWIMRTMQVRSASKETHLSES
jgi:hypothetical protein